jgi:acetyl esterase
VALDPQAEKVLAALTANPLPDPSTLEAPLLRQLFDGMLPPGPDEPVAAVEDRRIPGPAGEIPVRIYRGVERTPLPVLTYYHGGGFVIGSLDTHDATCRALAREAECLVVSVGYRLAPEHPYPAAPEDCYAAARWIAEQGEELGADPRRIAVGGDSAGGNLDAVVALMARERGGPHLLHQLLIYPVTDCAFDTPSYRENAEGYLLTRDMMQWFWEQYLAHPEDAHAPFASPLRAKDLSGLPPATVITAEHDPLRDEGRAYAARLHEAGVAVEERLYEGMFHGFFGMRALIERAGDAMAQATGALLRSFQTGPV